MRAIKVVYRSLKTLSFNKILRLLKLTLTHPILSTLAFYATLQAFSIAQHEYPKTASNNGRGNAFRHALWTCLIMMYCCKVSSPKKAYDYCKRMTDMHEELFPNEPLEKMMDLHNNQIGLDYFMSILPGIHRQFFEKGFFIDTLKQKTKDAVILESVHQELDDRLVYLKKPTPTKS